MATVAPQHHAQSDLRVVTDLQPTLRIQDGSFADPNVVTALQFFRAEDLGVLADPRGLVQAEQLAALAVRHELAYHVTQDLVPQRWIGGVLE